jgi:hypothetical protein
MIEPAGETPENERGSRRSPLVVNPTKQPDDYIKFEVLSAFNTIRDL